MGRRPLPPPPRHVEHSCPLPCPRVMPWDLGGDGLSCMRVVPRSWEALSSQLACAPQARLQVWSRVAQKPLLGLVLDWPLCDLSGTELGMLGPYSLRHMVRFGVSSSACV